MIFDVVLVSIEQAPNMSEGNNYEARSINRKGVNVKNHDFELMPHIWGMDNRKGVNVKNHDFELTAFLHAIYYRD